jgi:pimeloyl-ACP methyl ester carboxylesterase
MSVELALWIVLGGLALTTAALFTTLLARGMDRKAAKATVSERVESETLADLTPERMLGSMLKKHLLTSGGEADAEKAKATAKAAARRGGGAAAVAIFIALGGAGFGIAKNVMDDDGLDAVPVNREITAGELHGTLLSPKKNARVVLIVPGSGPTDRDGNNPMGVGANSYKLLAEALFADGIATVRVDKRGMFGSAAAGDPNAVSIETYAEDYHAWIDAVRAETGRKCVFLLGHSEGALMVSAAAAGRKDVCGLILVSGIGRKLGDVLREQLKANPANAPLLDQALPAIAEMEAGRHVDASQMHPALQQLFAPQVQDFLISEMKADPVEILKQARKRTLVIQGSADMQVSLEDAKLLNNAPRTKLEIIYGMNHVLKEAPQDRAGNLATYSDPSLPLHPKLEREIRRFVKNDD